MRFALAVLVVTGCHGTRSVAPSALVAHAGELRSGAAATVDEVRIQPFQDVEVIDADGRAHRIGVAQLLHDCPAGHEMQTAGCLLAGSKNVIVQRGNRADLVVFVAIAVAVIAGLAFSGDAP